MKHLIRYLATCEYVESWTWRKLVCVAYLLTMLVTVPVGIVMVAMLWEAYG